MADIAILVQKNQHGKVKFLKLTLEGERVSREWGLIDGAVQGCYYDYPYTNKGKANQLTPGETATADWERIIKTKIREGYVLVGDLDNLPELPEGVESFDFSDIPTGFCCSKPTQKVAARTINGMISRGATRFFVKYNGGCHYAIIDEANEVRLYTRRWEERTSKYPDIVKQIEDDNWPAETMLIGEFTVDPLLGLNHMWAFKRYAEIDKTDTKDGKCKLDQSVSIAMQQKYPIKMAVFGVLYYGGEKLWGKPYAEMWKVIEERVKPLSDGQKLFIPQEAIFKSGPEAFAVAKSMKKLLEGFVAVDFTKAMEVTMNGKPLRRASWKIKALAEMEVIAVSGNIKKKPGQYGSINIARYNELGELVSMGAVAGLKHKEGEADIDQWEFPCVIEIAYDNVFPDTGMLQFASFLKKHEDKALGEVPLFALDQS